MNDSSNPVTKKERLFKAIMEPWHSSVYQYKDWTELYYFASRMRSLDSYYGSHEMPTAQELASLPFKNKQQFGRAVAVALASLVPSQFFRAALINGNLRLFFAELFACHGCQQNPAYHEDDVFEHTLFALDLAAGERNCDPQTLLAILFHDIGKPIVRRETSE